MTHLRNIIIIFIADFRVAVLVLVIGILILLDSLADERNIILIVIVRLIIRRVAVLNLKKKTIRK